MAKIQVLNREVSIALVREEDYISLTDIAKHRNADDPRFIIQNWMRTRFTVEFLGIWECLNNPDFNRVEFEAVKNEAGRYGGTYAHKDIAFEFASWISVEFKLYLIKEFQRLKEQERQTLGWDIRRNLAKINYRIHTDAIQQHLIPPALNASQTSQIYASEADVLNLALFGQTAAQWRDANPDKKGNMRDDADVTQPVCLSNLENLNALFIAEGTPQQQRLERLNQIAIHQMTLLAGDGRMKLPGGEK